jgi:hypothetical protein
MSDFFSRYFGSLASALSALATTTWGVDAIDTVAIQCINGRSFGKYCVFNGSIDLPHRYDGLKRAFDSDNEIFKPKRTGSRVAPPALTVQQYDLLVTAAIEKQMLRNENVNEWLKQGGASQQLPIWRWSIKERGRVMTFAWAFVALCPMWIIAIIRLWYRQNMLPELCFAFCYCLVTAYGGWLLDFKREVAYIRVPATAVTPMSNAPWVRLWQSAVDGWPVDGETALEDLAQGTVRKFEHDLAIPALVLEPTVSFNTAEAWFTIRYLRGILLALPSYFGWEGDQVWLTCYGIAALVQACFQQAYARSFVISAKGVGIVWFRRMPGHRYEEEVVPFLKKLG